LHATEHFHGPYATDERRSTLRIHPPSDLEIIVSQVPFLSCVLAITLLAIAPESPAQDSPRTANPAMQEMMKRMMPGEGHKIFARMVGKWRGTMRVWSSAQPDAPPMESATESESRLVLGGRFVLEEASGTLMRMPMQRMSILGYDNARGQYTLVFYSSLDTATNTASGTANAAGNIITLTGEFNEPAGKEPFKNIIRFEGDDVHIFESYKILPDGKELKLIEQVMHRVK
jgi:hypothetical protein